MAVTVRQLGVAVAATAIIGSVFLLPGQASANGEGFRLGSSQWDPGGGDFRWTYGPSIAWYSSDNHLYNGSYSYGFYGTWGYGPLRDCGWIWRTHMNRRGHLIATSARCY